ncbi:MAG: GNAT family N-acetyltransferase [Kiloniellales bacterium]|nr:GNAT family N-acetyltransferase [Kiloniellales bacterium]
MRIRPYRPDDLPRLMRLFRETVHMVGAGHYTPEELAAWAPEDLDLDRWKDRLARNRALIAEDDGEISGFAELSPEGVVDMLFVHKDRQGRGIASALLAELEAEAGKAGFDLLTTQASRIAKPFFLSRGFALLAAQRVECRGLRIENFRMEKRLAP